MADPTIPAGTSVADEACNRPYRGTYGIRTAPCERPAGHDGFCRFEALLSGAVRQAVPVVALLLLLALALLADGAAAWGWAP